MNYTQAEQFLLSLSNIPRKEYEDRGGARKRYQKRMQIFLNLLGNPEKKLGKVIHIAGTSGKGSVATYLSNMLVAAHKKTGLMISPHPTHLRERWQINGKPMDEATCVRLMGIIKQALDEYERTVRGDAPSHFEVITAIGFLYFAEQHVDWSVVEVGMGGRYDATNALPHKDIAVITSIGLDHMDVLGDTKEKIAYEKAGIITPGCHTFTAVSDKKILAVIRKECEKQKTKLETFNVQCSISKQSVEGTDFQYHNQEYHIQSLGEHQVRNAMLCIDIAHTVHIPEAAIKRGLASAVQPLRFEIVQKNLLTILDGAHNPDKMKTTVETIKTVKHENMKAVTQHFGNGTMEPWGSLHLIIGFSADKNWKNMVKQLLTLHPASIACTRNTVNPFRKVVDPKTIAAYIKNTKALNHENIDVFLDPNDALAWSQTKQQKHDILLVTGSIFLSGELRPALTKT